MGVGSESVRVRVRVRVRGRGRGRVKSRVRGKVKRGVTVRVREPGDAVVDTAHARAHEYGRRHEPHARLGQDWGWAC